jgi:cation diffusion facilitator CzcD-associated flavoprotein CzcO
VGVVTIIANRRLTGPGPPGYRFSLKFNGMVGYLHLEANSNYASRRAQHVTAFSRGPTWITPSPAMEHHVYTDEEKQLFRDNPSKLLNMRKSSEAIMASASLFSTFLKGSNAQDVFRSQMEIHMKGKIHDDNLAKKLVPDFPFGCRRPTVQYLI